MLKRDQQIRHILTLRPIDNMTVDQELILLHMALARDIVVALAQIMQMMMIWKSSIWANDQYRQHSDLYSRILQPCIINLTALIMYHRELHMATPHMVLRN